MVQGGGARLDVHFDELNANVSRVGTQNFKYLFFQFFQALVENWIGYRNCGLINLNLLNAA